MNLKLGKVDTQKWYHNLLLFFAPVGILYFTQVMGFIQQANGGIKLTDFIPTQFTLGAIVLYIFNGVTDYLKKLKG